MFTKHCNTNRGKREKEERKAGKYGKQFDADADDIFEWLNRSCHFTLGSGNTGLGVRHRKEEVRKCM